MSNELVEYDDNEVPFFPLRADDPLAIDALRRYKDRAMELSDSPQFYTAVGEALDTFMDFQTDNEDKMVRPDHAFDALYGPWDKPEDAVGGEPEPAG